MNPEHGGALIPRADHIRTCPARIVSGVPAGHQVPVGPAVKVQLQRGLHLQETVGDGIGRGGVRPNDVLRGVGVDGVRVAIPGD